MRLFVRTVPLLVLLAAGTPLLAGCDCPFLARNCSTLGGASTPTTPTTTPPPTTFTLSGRIVRTQGGAPIAGATVAVGGTAVQSDGNGAFSATLGTAASSVTVSAPGFLTRSTSVAGGQERNVAIDLISTAGDFDLDFFDRLARGKEQAPTFPNYIVRWQRNPSFYLITKITRFQNGAFVSTDQDAPQAALDRIHGMLAGLVSDATGGRLQVGQVLRRPDARPESQLEEGFVQVELAEAPGGAGTTDDCGFGGTSFSALTDFSTETNRKGFARLYLTPICRCQADGLLPASHVIAHEIGHSLGFGHTHPQRDSVMSYQTTEPCSAPTFSRRDREYGALTYLRPSATSPRTTTRRDSGFSGSETRRVRPLHFPARFPGAHGRVTRRLAHRAA